MKRRFTITFALLLCQLTYAFGQQQQPAAAEAGPQKDKQGAQSIQSGPPQSKDKGDVVRISVTLVQVDVTVVDKKGNPVADLKPEDFEVFQDGRPQRITNFSYISRQAAQPAPASPAPAADKKPVFVPPPRLRPEQVRRTIALVVDDLTLSFGSTHSVRQSLRKFVDEQMQPGDLVAIVRTGAGMGALQQFTNDKRQLYAAIERVRWSPSHGTLYTFAPIEVNPNPRIRSVETLESDEVKSMATTFANAAYDLTGNFGKGGPSTDSVNEFRQEVFAIGTLGALGFIVRGLKELPGRKSVVLFSDALRIYNREQTITRVEMALRNLTDLANRASVVIYTIDARGLQTLGITAADDLTGDLRPMDRVDISDYSEFLGKTETGLADRGREFFESQEGLRYLADQTGGFFIRNTNDLNRGLARVLNDQEGYYLIGFTPEESTFKTKKGAREFHDIKIKLKRPDLRLRTRTGFYGVAEEEEAQARRGSAGQQLLTALTSPFSSGDIRVRMTSQLGQDPRSGAFINALLHIDARDLTFTETVNGWRKVTFEIAAFTFGDNGKVIDQSDRAYTVNMSDKDYRRTLESGVFYRINLPIKKPGAYQLRTAVRDHTSQKLGSANQFIEVPDLKKSRLAVAGLILRGNNRAVAARAAASAASSSAAEQVASAKEGKVEEANPQASPAVRRLERGMVLEYAYAVYNPQLDKATKRPQLETQLMLYRDGRPVFAGRVKPFDLGGQADFNRLIGGGSMLIGTDLEPGEYILQVIVTDKLAKEDHRYATQWLDFEIVK